MAEFDTGNERSPFGDLKVVDFSWAVAGPTIGRTLTDYGATVVKIESRDKVDTARVIGPYHDGRRDIDNSALYDNCNVGKLGLVLDLSQSSALDVAHDLITWADVLIESFSPGVMAKWGLDYASVSAFNPSIVMLSTSIIGQTGPYRKLAGAGNIGSAMSGFQHMTGWPDLPPFGPYGPYTDFVSPRFSLCLLLAALDQRRRTGEGGYLDVSQAEAAAHLLGPEIAQYFDDGVVANRVGNADPDLSPHGVYPCQRLREDEPGWIAIAIRHDEDWRQLQLVANDAALNDERFDSHDARQRFAAEIDALLEAWTLSQDPEQLEAELQRRGVPAHIAASSRAMFEDPQLEAYEHFIPVEFPGTSRAFIQRGAFQIEELPRLATSVAPSLGRDNEFVLGDLLGYSPERIAELAQSGVLS